MNLSGRTLRDIEDIAENSGVAPRTIFRWIERYKKWGFRGLITSEAFGGKGQVRTDGLAESVLNHLVDSDYQDPLPSNAEFYRRYRTECWNTGVKAHLSYKTVSRRLGKVKQRLAVETRSGKNSRPTGFTSRRTFADKEYPLQTIQIDHSKLDIILLDEWTGREIGRPWLTIGIDVYSRCIWGYYLGLQHPNADTVGLTMINGCFSKQNIVDLFTWQNGPSMEFHTKSTQTTARISAQEPLKEDASITKST